MTNKNKKIKTKKYKQGECLPLPRPNNPLIKPHLNSLDPDFYLDLSPIKHTHKYQFPKHEFYLRIH